MRTLHSELKATATTFELRPGVGVGSLELGMTIWDILNHLSSSETIYTSQCSLAWDDHNPHSSAILLSLLDRISLLFDPVSQRLTAIQVEPALVDSLSYKGRALIPASSSSIVPLRLLHATFGPTYPPAPHPAFTDEAILSYPGVIFSFLKEHASTSSENSKGQESSPYQPIRRVIVTGHNPNNDNAHLFPEFLRLSTSVPLPPLASGDFDHVDITLGDDSSPTSVSLHIIADDQDAPTPITVQIGISTTEDLLCELGPPNRIFYKEDSRLSIHSAKTDDTSNGAAFYNYFALGIDFLIHPTAQRVQKIILHSNTPGEVLFGRYAKCRWALKRSGENGASACSEDGAEKVKRFLSTLEKGENASSREGHVNAKGETSSKSSHGNVRMERPLLLDRVADSGDGLKLDRTTELCAYPGVVLEVTQNNCVETLWLV